MTDPIPTDTDPLLLPLGGPQKELLAIIGDAVMATGAWPVYQYVQAKLDDLGLDSEEVFAGLPSFSHLHLTYSLARRDRTGREEEPVKLTVAGMAHLDRFASTVEMFLQAVNELADRRAAAPFEPGRVVTVEISWPELVTNLGLNGEPLLDLLPELLQGEPATWHGPQQRGDAGWIYQPSSHLRRFRRVRDVNDYLTRMRAWIMPPEPAPAPQPVSPLGVVAAFDYLDVVWQLKFGRKVMHVPSAERAARLALPVSTPEEFDNRLSALGEMFKGLDAAPDMEAGPFDKMRRFLTRELPAESLPAVRAAINTMFHVTHIRNSGQHFGAATQAAVALPALGLDFPITDHAAAWRIVQTHVINALDTIRVEVNTLPTGQPPRPTPVGAPGGGRSRPRRPAGHGPIGNARATN
ncbi:hypothetical protein [Micromonospora chersina]|uniref:hypothetical protein n=1 Tax=Micromonospora chersina TaxID=47854 RepID=UPI0037187626